MTWMLLGALIVGLLTAATAQAAPVTWALMRSADPKEGTTSCRQDDGVGEFPTDLTAEGSGCSWRKWVLVPDWIRSRLTGIRAFVGTDAYYGTWRISGLALDGTTRVGTMMLSNRSGSWESAPLDPAAVIGPEGRAGLALDGDPYAGTFITLSRSGVRVDYDDSEAPRVDPADLALPGELRRRQPTPPLAISILENGPIVSSALILWGDGTRDELLVQNPAGTWDGAADTRFGFLLPPDRHRYVRDGVYRPEIRLTDSAGNLGVHPLGVVRVGPPPLRLVTRPIVRGRARVDERLVCSRGRWEGRPTRYRISWQVRKGRAWRAVGLPTARLVLRRSLAGRSVRCIVRASRDGRVLGAASGPVRVRAPRVPPG